MSEIEPWPTDAALMVRFTADANRIISVHGGNTPSRRKTVIPIGATVTVVIDYGHGLVDVAWRKDTYRLHRSYLMLEPTPQIVAHNATEVLRLGNELRLLRQEYERVLQEKQDLEAKLERMTERNGLNVAEKQDLQQTLDWVREALAREHE